MKIYNSFSKKLEDFIVDDLVKIYVCGPTVYDLPHLGHGRSVVAYDFIRKFLNYRGFKTKFVSNYTDIDDKMIQRANERAITVADLAKEIIAEVEKDYAALGVLKPDFTPKATEHIERMIEMIKILKEQDIAYRLEDGWYYDVSKFSEYGKLSGQNLDDLKAGARVDLVDGKRNSQDFVLWKLRKDGEPFWEDEVLGEGRPGWHIECSAMINEVFNGVMIDLHGGGEDLLFPHHECEIAQSEACFDSGFVKYWAHNAFVMINDEKMSKSLNNFKTLRDVFAEFDPIVIRFFYLQQHYRYPINFHDDALEQAKNSLEKIWNFYERINLDYLEESPIDEEVALIDFEKQLSEIIAEIIAENRQKLIENIEKDFDSGKGLTVLYDFINQVSPLLLKSSLNLNSRNLILNYLSELDAFFGYIVPKRQSIIVRNDLNDNSFDNLLGFESLLSSVKQQLNNADFDLQNDELRKLALIRLKLRANKDFTNSDLIRDELKKFNLFVEDGKDWSILKRG